MGLRESDIAINKMLEQRQAYSVDSKEFKQLTIEFETLLKKSYENLTAWDRVYLARHPERAKYKDFIDSLFDDFIELHGDRHFADDSAIVCGLANFCGEPVTILAQAKGEDLAENMKRNFGMSGPEGYRKAIRLAHQAQKFNRPIITIVDTPGAYPGKGAEERGQAEAIARCLYEFSILKVPVICIVISEGGSGGALALSVADRIIMLENAIYSILSPEGFATILWKDASKAPEASDLMKLQASDLFEQKIIDYVVKEIEDNKERAFAEVINDIKNYMTKELTVLKAKNAEDLTKERFNKFRNIGIY